MTVPNICRNIFHYFGSMSRKKLIIIGASSTIALILLIVIIVVSTQKTDTPTKGRDALSNTPLIDGHNDLPTNLKDLIRDHLKDFPFEKNLTDDAVWGKKACKSCFTDLPRLKAGKVGAQFWVAYVDCTQVQYKDAVAETLEQIDVIKRLIRKYPKDLKLALTPDDIVDAFEDNKIGSLIAVEGGHSIDSRLGVLRTFYDLGVRYMTLTHTCDTPWGDASTTVVSHNNLTNFGKVIVKEMNRLGMMVDLSHVSANVMRDAIAASRAPVIFSHSSAFAVHNHARNVPDDVLKSVATNDGIVMVNFYPGFLGPNMTAVNINTVIQHINHIVDVAGIDHVGIGGDYDGVSQMPQGLEDVSKYPVLFDLLYLSNSTKWSINNLEKLAGKNLLRVFKRVEEVRDALANEDVFDEWIPKEDMDAVSDAAAKQCRNPNDTAADIITTVAPPVTKASTTVPAVAEASTSYSPVTETSTLKSSNDKSRKHP